MLLVVFGLGRFDRSAETSKVTFHFELHAPGADHVELLGTFNHWKSGDIVLNGPDASGHWTAEVALPVGRHEYIFLVDGKRWVADPKAATHRPDGFGRVNTVIKVYDDEDAAHG
jgi:1,4-alpha-glucan branching enzyme